MSEISKTIERVKELDKGRTQVLGFPGTEYSTIEYHDEYEDSKTVISQNFFRYEAKLKKTDADFIVESANSIMPIIKGYEQSQKELERLQKTVDDNFVHDYNEEYAVTQLKAELETANKRIAELEKSPAKKRKRVRRGYSGRQLR